MSDKFYSNFKKNTRIASGRTLRYESFLGDIDKEINAIARKKRIKAGNHVKEKLRQAATQKFGADSNIVEGIGSKQLKTTSIVGVGPPAQAAHLIEFGTDERYQRKGKYTGKIKKDPFVFPVYIAETPEVERILSEEWF